MKELLDRGAVAAKDEESSRGGLQRRHRPTSRPACRRSIFGITAQEIDQAEQQGTAIRTELAVRSPIAGVVVQKLVSPGMLIQAGATVCFMISDVSTVWVQGHIFDRDLPRARGRSGGGNQPLLRRRISAARWPTSERLWTPPRAPRRSASSPGIPRGC
jgi:multidrug efflux pump subunit AcrA (membrane-fusion protein)